MSKARDLANAGTALGAVTATELAFVDGVTSAIQTQIDSKEATLPSQTGNSGKYLTTNGTAKSWGTVSQYALPTQTGNSGKFLTTNGTAESWGTVTSPITWTPRYTHPTNLEFTSIATNNSTIYVAVGLSGTLVSSTDSGVTWATRTSGFSTNAINSVAFGNGIFVAVGAAGTITTSTDGVTWTARTSNVSTNELFYVAYLNSNFVAVGNGGNAGTGGITTSTDGITWTKRNTPAGSPATFYGVDFGNGYYLAVGDPATVSGCHSTNLSTWTNVDASLTADGRYVVYTSDDKWVVGAAGTSGGNSTGSNNPSGTWTNYSDAGLFILSGSKNGSMSAVQKYDNKIYYVSRSRTAVGAFLYIVNSIFTAVSSKGFSQSFQPILLPVRIMSESLSDMFQSHQINNIDINTSTGGIVISSRSGQIWTSF
jgi:hypothetical protein